MPDDENNMKRAPKEKDARADPPITRQNVERAISRLSPESWAAAGERKWSIVWND